MAAKPATLSTPDVDDKIKGMSGGTSKANGKKVGKISAGKTFGKMKGSK